MISSFEADVFGAFERSFKVEVGDVDGHELCTGSGDDAVEEDFGHKHFCGGGGDFTRVVDSVATNGEPSAVWFKFLRADAAHKFSVGDVFSSVGW